MYWDGRDSDGDYPANGVYLVKVEATSSLSGETAHAFAKAVGEFVLG